VSSSNKNGKTHAENVKLQERKYKVNEKMRVLFPWREGFITVCIIFLYDYGSYYFQAKLIV